MKLIDACAQLVFAGGKEPLRADDKPFIARLVQGTQVAIDPMSYMNSAVSSSSGSVAADVVYDATGAARGKCCIRYEGRYGNFAQSFWSRSTFLCQ